MPMLLVIVIVDVCAMDCALQGFLVQPRIRGGVKRLSGWEFGGPAIAIVVDTSLLGVEVALRQGRALHLFVRSGADCV